MSEEDAGLIAAAETAASWAHARRATWTSEPLAAIAATPAPPPPAALAVIPPATLVVIHPAAAAPHAAPARTWSPSVRQWAVRGAIAAALVAAAALGGPYVWTSISTSMAHTAVVAPAASVGPVAPAGPSTPAAKATAKATGGLRVTSTPMAQVLVDGKARGTTPLNLSGLSLGSHELTLMSPEGTVRRTVTVAANDVATIDEAIFAGWVAVSAPFDLTVTEKGRALRADDRNQVMLPAGTHELRLTNQALGYEVTRQVEVKPGEATPLQLTPEPSTLTVTATGAAEVWIDGTRVGETPLNAASVQLGTHDILVKRAAGGERRFTVTIGVKPSMLNVEF